MCISFFKRFACCRGRSMAGKSSHIHHPEYAATSGSCGVLLKNPNRNATFFGLKT